MTIHAEAVLSKSSSLLAITLLAAGSTVAIAFFLDDESRRVERHAEETVCREMAGEALGGEASRFDYMATRCPARFLTAVEAG